MKTTDENDDSKVAKAYPVPAAIIISDLHNNCQMGLCPPHPRLDSGGHYERNKFQDWLWDKWLDFRKWAKVAVRGDKFCVIVNGDIHDHRHHGAVTQWTQNMADARRAALTILEPIVEWCDGQFYVIRGTEAHSGPSSESEEQLADELGAIPDKEGNHARYELWKLLKRGKKDALIHCLHHIGTTGSQQYETTAVHKELVEAYVEAGRWHDRPPDIVCRSHRHRYVKTEVASDNDRAVAIVTPGWQGKVPLVYRIAGGRSAQPQFGGILVRISEEGELYVRQRVYRLPRPEAE